MPLTAKFLFLYISHHGPVEGSVLTAQHAEEHSSENGQRGDSKEGGARLSRTLYMIIKEFQI